MRKSTNLLWLWIVTCHAFSAVGADEQEKNPYEPKENLYRTPLLVVGGSSAGTAAAITAGRLGVNTIWTLRSPRDLGGLSTNAVNPDSDLAIRYIGGLAFEYDVVARYTTGHNAGRGRGSGEGYFAPFQVFFRYARQQVDGLPSVVVLANLYPIAVEKDPRTRRVARVTFGHRLDTARRVVVEPQVTIDAEIEGDVAYLAGVEMTLRREGMVPSDDPTRDRESYAGRLFTPAHSMGSMLIAGGPPLPASTHAADTEAATMAWNGSVSLQDYGHGTPDSPWVLKNPPPGYDPAALAWWKSGLGGVYLGAAHFRWNIGQYLSVCESWRMPDGRHVLESMDIRDREANEKAQLAQVIRGLWHLQHAMKQYRYGLSATDFHEGLPPKYRLSDFGTTTNAGDAPLPGLIYMREGRRMVNDHVFGGKLIEDDGSHRYLQKRYWHPRAAYFNAMLVDIHGVHLEKKPGSGPEGMQLLRLAGFYNFGVPAIPFDVFVPRTSEATGLLVASAGAYTHQAYAAFPRMETGRIAQGHACAVAAQLALCDGLPVHQVDVRKVQIRNLLLHGQSLVYFDDTIPGTYWQLVDQMLGARRVPERNEQGVFQREDRVTVAEAAAYLRYLFHDYCEHPLPAEKLQAATAALGSDPQAAVSRAKMLTALGIAAGLELPQTAPQPLADVPADTPLARQLAAWIRPGWIAADRRHSFRPDEPIPFSEFKRHAYHVLFGPIAPETVRAVDYRPWLVHDTFNRADGPLTQLAGGQAVSATGSWPVAAGSLRPTPDGKTVYLLADAGQSDADVAADVFLLQTTQPASAGIVVRAADGQNMQRFLLTTEGPDVRVRIDTVVDGKRTAETEQVRHTLRRGFTLRLVARGERLTYFLDAEQIYVQRRPEFRAATRVGLVCGGTPSLFDNFEVRTVE